MIMPNLDPYARNLPVKDKSNAGKLKSTFKYQGPNTNLSGTNLLSSISKPKTTASDKRIQLAALFQPRTKQQ